MALSHVSMITEYGLQPATTEQAAKIHPHGASVRSGLFVCRLCGQYVTLCKNINHTFYFRHSRGDKDKACPERIISFSDTIDTMVQQRPLPLRLTVHSAYSFSIAIGIALPSGISTDVGELSISGSDSKPYFFHMERLEAGNISFLPLGQDIAAKYRLSCSENTPDDLRRMIPNIVNGVAAEGTLFRKSEDSRSGTKILHGSNVHVGTTYYLLIRRPVQIPASSHNDISCSRICSNRINHRDWYVYAVKANRYEQDAISFFLQFHYFLSEAVDTLVPVWPVHISSPYVTYHNAENMWFYLNAQDVTAQTYPSASVRSYPCRQDCEQVLNVLCRIRQQTLLAGKSKILRYIYLWKGPLAADAKQPAARVTDINEAEIPEGERNELPPKRILRISGAYDGKVLIRKNGRLKAQRQITANTVSEVDEISFGTEILVYQGLDPVWQCFFHAPPKNASGSDEHYAQLLRQCSGELVSVPHRYGGAIRQLHDMPMVRQQLEKWLHDGYMPYKALLIMKRIILEKRCSND